MLGNTKFIKKTDPVIQINYKMYPQFLKVFTELREVISLHSKKIKYRLIFRKFLMEIQESFDLPKTKLTGGWTNKWSPHSSNIPLKFRK